MTASTAPLASVRTAFTGLIDYAGLFPPAELPLAQARSKYEAARLGPYAWMLGRFIVPASQLTASAEQPGGEYSVIVDPNVDALNRVAGMHAGGVRVAALEIPLTHSASSFHGRLSRDEVLDALGALETDLAVCGLGALPTYVEIPRTQPWTLLPETMDALSRFGLGAKLRCGGSSASAFPTVDMVADFMVQATRARVPFKATAGLHHPVRHVDPATGFPMHGFLNILAAAALAFNVDRDVLQAIVAEEEPNAFAFDDSSFAWRDRRIGLVELTRTRREAFLSYGSCSFAEPVEDLTALGLLPSP